MGKSGDIRRAIQILAGTYDKDLVTFEIATITEVNTDSGSPNQWSCTATPVSGIAPTEITDIQLTAELASNGFILVPTVGSNVILAITIRNEVYVMMCSEVDQVIFYRDNGDGTFQSMIINDTIAFGDGTFGGMIKLVDPTDATAGVLKRLNEIEQFITTLQTAINGWAPVPNDGGAALKAALTSWLSSIAPSTIRGQLENTGITQGKPLT